MLAIIQPFAPVAVYSDCGCDAAGDLVARCTVAFLSGAKRSRRTRATFPRTQFIAAFIAGLITAPLLLYLYSATQADAVLRAWSQQNQTPSPPPLDYLLGYGLLWIFAFFGARQAWRRKTDWDVLLLVWIS